MSHFKFIILPRNELLGTQADDIYTVKDVIPIKDMISKLQDAKIGYDADGTDFILENFDTYFSILVHGKKLEKHITEKAYSQISKAFKQFVLMLSHYISDDNELEKDMLTKICNILKMLMYILIGLINFFDEIHVEDDSSLLIKKKRGKKIRSDDETAWQEEKHELLVTIYNCMQLPIHKLWDPPMVEQDFITLVANACYKCLEDPAVKKIEHLRQTIFQIIGTLIKTYNHGMECPSRLVKLLQTHEHSVTSVSRGVVTLVSEYGCKSLINRLLRSIIEWQLGDKQVGLTTSEIKQCSSFLVELAVMMPDKMIPEVIYLGNQLENDSYQLRITILTIMAEIVIVLSGEGLTDEAKEQRDYLLDILEERFVDVNAFTRSKILQLWGRLQQEQAIPVSRQHVILQKTTERLRDKAMGVRKHAVSGVKIFLECNPFAPTLNIEKIEEQLAAATVKSKELNKKLRIVKSVEKKAIWVAIHAELREFIKDKLSEPEDESEETTDESSTDSNENILLIQNCIMKKDYEEAFRLVRISENNVPDARRERAKLSMEEQIDYKLMLFHQLFMASEETTEQVKLTPAQIVELENECEGQDQVVTFLQASKEFAILISEASIQISTLLRSKTITECTEAIDYFTAANKFVVRGSLDCALGMLSLVYINEKDRTDAVVRAFKTMFLTTTAKSDRGHSVEVVQNLLMLIKSIEQVHYEAFRQIVLQWIKEGELKQDEIQLMWELFTLKIPDTSEVDSLAALKLLIIVAEAKPEIVHVNVNVLELVIETRGPNDLRLVEDICAMLLNLTHKFKATPNKAPQRYGLDSDFVKRLTNIVQYGWSLKSDNYLKMTTKVIDVLYAICEQPDIICTKLICDLYKELFRDTEDTNEPAVCTKLLTQFIHIVGHVGLRQLAYLDITIYKELKRRNLYREELENKQKTAKKNSRKSNLRSDESVSSNASVMTSASLSKKMQQPVDDEQMAVEGAVADDADADYILDALESDILSKNRLLGLMAEILIRVCQNPSKCKDERLMVTAAQALTKLMYMSSKYADGNLQLVFTMLEKSENEVVRSSIILALSDLVKRFPNLIEPWTPHMYKRLRDPSLRVRQMTMIMLSHLIHHDMIRVKGHISEMAICIVDDDPDLNQMAKSFFRQLSQKGNALYNVMPDIISKLSDTSATIDEKQFKIILKYIMDLIQKEKQMESLVSKLCARLRVSVSARQWCDLSYCLSIINYNDRALKHLLENVPAFKEKFHNERVYNNFKIITISASKNAKPEVKALATELAEKIENCLQLNEIGEEVVAPPKETPAKVSTTRARKTVRKKKADTQQSSDSEMSGVEDAVPATTKAVKSVRKSARRLICSDSSDDSSVQGPSRRSTTSTVKKQTKLTRNRGQNRNLDKSSDDSQNTSENERRSSARFKALKNKKQKTKA